MVSCKIEASLSIPNVYTLFTGCIQSTVLINPSSDSTRVKSSGIRQGKIKKRANKAMLPPIDWILTG